MSEEGTIQPPGADAKVKPPFWRRLLRKRLLWTAVLLLVLVWYGSYKFERLILNPPEQDWGPVALEDLGAEHWYETEEGKKLTEKLRGMTESAPIRFATGMYYREYRRRFSAGFRNTQLVKVGPDQYPAIYEMVTDACQALGTIDGVPIRPPRVYLGWTGKQGFEITNYTDPCIVIGNDFLWAYKPDELRYLVARQVGHLQCKHIYFLDVVKGARAIINSALPDFLARVVLGGMGGELLDWMKEAQVSADRAGLLVTGDVDVACQALIKLNIHASLDDFYGQPNPEAFAAQIKLVDQDRVSTASAALAELKNPNPFLTVRVADLLKFYGANSSLFMDRRSTRQGRSVFDPGELLDLEPPDRQEADQDTAPAGEADAGSGEGQSR